MHAARRQDLRYEREVIISAIALVASTATAIISVLSSARTQRVSIREERLWDARREAYEAAAVFVEELYRWFDAAGNEPPPRMQPQDLARLRLYTSKTSGATSGT